MEGQYSGVDILEAGEESFDASPQLGIAASLIQEGRPGVPALDLEGRKEDLFEIRCCLVH